MQKDTRRSKFRFYAQEAFEIAELIDVDFYVWNDDVTPNHMTLTFVEVIAPNKVISVTLIELSIVFVISEVVSTLHDIWREMEAILEAC